MILSSSKEKQVQNPPTRFAPAGLAAAPRARRAARWWRIHHWWGTGRPRTKNVRPKFNFKRRRRGRFGEAASARTSRATTNRFCHG